MRNRLMDRVLYQKKNNQLTQHQLAFLGETLMEGGSDTSSSLILAIIQAMTQYSEVQSRRNYYLICKVSSNISGLKRLQSTTGNRCCDW